MAVIPAEVTVSKCGLCLCNAVGEIAFSKQDSI
jgi:hypothetical protein